MVCFQTKNPNLGKNFGASDWKMVIYFMAIGNILWIFGIFYDHSVHFVSIFLHFFQFWYHAPRKIWQPCNSGDSLFAFVKKGSPEK
jgi:hypothetical protein